MKNTARPLARILDSTIVQLLIDGAFACGLAAAAVTSPARAATPADWQCSNKIGGQWAFGNAPNACNVNHKQDPASARAEFKQILFKDANAGTAERNRYMSELYPSLREFAGYYILRRKPSATAAEVAAFQRALFTLAHQESFWTHYRDGSDGLVRYMRGDNGHGHGIMQIDDNAHFAEIDKGKGADFAENVIYGLGVFYSAWQQAATQSCVSSPTNWEERTRAAWGAYNGGPGSICRYKNPDSRWASHDRGFKAKFDGQAWNAHVANRAAPSPLDARCLSEGARPCAVGAPNPSPQAPVEGFLYSASGGRYCLAKSGAFDCVSSFADVACLEAREDRSLPVSGALSSQDEGSRTARNLERSSLCLAYVAGLISIGTDLKLQTAINFRATPGGALLGQLAAGGVYRALDFAIENGGASADRYYKLSANGAEGWIYAGAQTSWASWVKASEPDQPAPFPSTAGLAKADETVEIVMGAINIRQTPGGTPILGTIPSGARVVAQEIVVRGADSDVFYKISYASKTGYIYSGALRPTNTVASWTRVVQAARSPAARTATLPPSVPYRYLRTCGGPSCSYSDVYVLGGSMNNQCQNSSCSAKGDLMQVLQIDGGWAQVRKLPSGGSGWLPQTDVVEFAP